VVPDGQALTKSLELAEMICANGPLAVEAILKSVQDTAAMPEVDALKVEFEIGWPIFSTNDSKEGPRAFAEKRSPNWTRT
jgi:enoyl-CoA hydratase